MPAERRCQRWSLTSIRRGNRAIYPQQSACSYLSIFAKVKLISVLLNDSIDSR